MFSLERYTCKFLDNFSVTNLFKIPFISPPSKDQRNEVHKKHHWYCHNDDVIFWVIAAKLHHFVKVYLVWCYYKIPSKWCQVITKTLQGGGSGIVTSLKKNYGVISLLNILGQKYLHSKVIVIRIWLIISTVTSFAFMRNIQVQLSICKFWKTLTLKIKLS